MKANVKIEGQSIEIELTKEQIEQLTKSVKKDDGRVERGEDYFQIHQNGSIYPEDEAFTEYDDESFNMGNYYHTKEEAEFARDKQIFLTALKRRIKELNGDWVADFGGDGETNYSLSFSKDNKLILNFYVLVQYTRKELYFKSEEIGAQLITEFTEEKIIKYLFN